MEIGKPERVLRVAAPRLAGLVPARGRAAPVRPVRRRVGARAAARGRVPARPPAPSLECACGIYAAREPEDALVYLTGRDEPGVVGRVLGRVALWGLVVEGEHGWRAELAYPAALESDAAVRYAAPQRSWGEHGLL